MVQLYVRVNYYSSLVFYYYFFLDFFFKSYDFFFFCRRVWLVNFLIYSISVTVFDKNKVILYCTGNYIQYIVTNNNEKIWKRLCIYSLYIYIYIYVYRNVCVHAYQVAQLCLTLYDPMDCSPPGSSVQKLFQARILEWVALSSSMGSFWPRNWTHTSVSCISM